MISFSLLAVFFTATSFLVQIQHTQHYEFTTKCVHVRTLRALLSPDQSVLSIIKDCMQSLASVLQASSGTVSYAS
jgi:hypothetical protein